MSRSKNAKSKRNYSREKYRLGHVSRRVFLKTCAGITLAGTSLVPVQFLSADDVPPEPENLDEPTQWQEGDPEPEEREVPATEPEQKSQEAPPCQPMDDDRGEQPDSKHAWVYGYWWWTDGKYVWVPGYWSVPPKPEYVYIPGYWTYRSPSWVYIRGGWGMPNTTTVVVYANPRPVLTVFVVTAPIRIIRRNRRWRHRHSRRRRHRPHRSRNPRLRPSPARGPSRGPTRAQPARGPSRGPSGSPSRGPSGSPSRGPSGGSRPGGPVRTN